MKIVNWGIIGLGGIAHKFAEGLKQVKNAKLLGVASRDINKAQKFATQYNAEKYYDSYEKLAADTNVDIIYIATPHSFHHEHTLLCLKNKKAVLCEKPFAINIRQVNEMIDCAKKNNVFLMEAMWTRFLPHINATIDIIKKNTIGTPKMMTADFGMKTTFNPEHRLFNIQLGGGALLDIGIYPVFLALLIFGKPDNIKAFAHIGRTGVDENCGIVFSYNDGKMAVLHTTFLAETSLEANIFGTEGNIRLCKRWHNPTDIIYTTDSVSSELLQFNHAGNGYNYEAEEATKCLIDGKTESDIMPLSFSLDLIQLLDRIRQECGIVYHEDDL